MVKENAKDEKVYVVSQSYYLPNPDDPDPNFPAEPVACFRSLESAQDFCLKQIESEAQFLRRMGHTNVSKYISPNYMEFNVRWDSLRVKGETNCEYNTIKELPIFVEVQDGQNDKCR